ncbi:MAG: metallophosphoesterase [Victivallaceae bacterium]|nr:metallophosphoesterase [Victivallaceae bacterium]
MEAGIFRILLIIISLAMFGCRSNWPHYNMLVFGDMHYSFPEAHDYAALSPARQKEYRRNQGIWNKRSPEMINYASHVANGRTAAVLQVGDISQGDGKSADKQSELFDRAYATLDDAFPGIPVYVTKGNHDIRVAKEEWNTFDLRFPEMLKKTPESSFHSKCNCIIDRGPDAIVVFDSFHKPDFEWALAALDRVTDRRYIFFLTHYPALGVKKPSTSYSPELLAKLRKVGAIIVCGHVHRMGVAEMTGITQLVVNSVGNQTGFSTLFDDYPSFLAQSKPEAIDHHIAMFPDGAATVVGYKGYGFVKLDVGPRSVTATFYDADTRDEALVWQLKPTVKLLVDNRGRPRRRLELDFNRLIRLE